MLYLSKQKVRYLGRDEKQLFKVAYIGYVKFMYFILENHSAGS